MADQTQKQTHGVLGDVKSALKGVKGAGDTIRGTFNESVDTAFHEREGEAKNKAIKEKGIADMEGTDAHFSKHKGTAHTTATTNQPYNGTTSSVPVDQHPAADPRTVPQTGAVTGGLARNTQLSDGTSTGAGAHSGAVGSLESRVPQERLGGEPTHSNDRY
ncbi:hypothetical protein LTR84_005292 [Exophiala bonariae]|uniref:CsbD-like domain-containing protein n=1 Tax=Exophiala bonariae TaxID=1690606 RepID=A0AAV9NT37_9EURO|nr:hypothetical protein LTR84_005292 [Exophiala bonariae]